ncbi:MAG: AAA family ATPase [Prevotellaceae bacterium]|jgi:AAA15 family ATPase/GTPase|nr:AAA family ATPase [Prevotellaceae bacterium]
MANFIEHIRITNFKSMRDLEMDGCRRINLLIGYPNVGKSNLLEALSLFSVPFLREKESLNRFIRGENQREMFHNALHTECSVKINMVEKALLTLKNLTLNLNVQTDKYDAEFAFDEKLRRISIPNDFDVNIKRYIFASDKPYRGVSSKELLPPYGENISEVLANDIKGEGGATPLSSVIRWMDDEFAKIGLEYILDMSAHCIRVQRRLDGVKVFQQPYASIADTLQRIIFYKTAIASNENSVLLFEEPEAHAFPPYIKTITQDIINSTSNQFFIATHSPIILNDFIEYADVRKEVAIYLLSLQDGQTAVKRLSNSEVDEVYNYGEDLFFNIEKFL